MAASCTFSRAPRATRNSTEFQNSNAVTLVVNRNRVLRSLLGHGPSGLSRRFFTGKATRKSVDDQATTETFSIYRHAFFWFGFGVWPNTFQIWNSYCSL